VRVVVHGRVQGVGFRYAVVDRARLLGLGGWVRNRPDGTVEAAFEGPHERVRSIVDWCRRGPRGARVDRLEEHHEAPLAEHSFTVR
jgi:acylphosphatase